MQHFIAYLYIETKGVIPTESSEINIENTETSYEVRWTKHHK
jgi:hypothetical protein